MSRARLFKRAANWLKNCIKTKEQAEQQEERRRAFQFAFGQLEERVVLDADFSFNGIDVDMNNFSSLGSEALSVGETATHYEFTLAEGMWSGTDSADVFGTGGSVLSVAKTSAVETINADAGSINIDFGAVDFDAGSSLTSIDFSGGDITQSGAILADSVDATFAGDLIEFKTQTNDFTVVDVDGSNVFLDDTDDIQVDVNSSTSVRIDTAGDIDVLSATFVSNLSVNSLANGGAGGDILIENAVGTNLIAEAGVGDIDATHAGNDFTAIIIDSADNADFVDPNNVNLRGITANSFSIVAGNDIRIQKEIDATDVLLDAGNRINQTGFQITATNLTAISGENTLLRQSGNAIDNFSADIEGDLNLVNSVNLLINSNSFQFGDGTFFDTTGADIEGNVDIEMIDLDLAANVVPGPFQIGGHLSLTLGMGCANLRGADHEFNTVEIVSADHVDMVSSTGFSITSANLVTDFSASASGDIAIDGNLSAGNQVLLLADNISQNAGIISAAGLLVETTGDATFAQANEIGSMGTPGQFSALVGGNLILNNIYGIDVADQTFTFKDGFTYDGFGLDVTGDACIHAESIVFTSGTFSASNFIIDSNSGLSISDITVGDLILMGAGNFDVSGTNNIGRLAADIDGDLSIANDIDLEIADLSLCGVQVVGVMTTGDWDVVLTDDNLTDSAESIVGGKATYDIGSGDGALDHANNDFFQVEIVNSTNFLLNDANDVDLMAANGTVLDFISNTGARLHGDVIGTDAVTFTSNVSGGVDQVAGIIDTDHLSLSGLGDFTLNSLNQIRNEAASSIVTEVETNNSLAGAQNVDGGNFVLTSDPDIFDSTTIPHISVEGTGDGTFDFYSFTISAAGQVGNFDIDYEDFDSELFLFNSAGDVLAANDDSFNSGSGSGLSSFINHTFASAGTYYIAVGRFNSSSTGGGIITGNAPEVGQNYTLHISLEGKEVGFAGLLTVDTTSGNVSVINDHGIEFIDTASVAGDLMVTTTDDDIKQDAATPVTVSGTATFYAGSGDVCLEFGDGNADLFNDNDFNVVNLNGGYAEVVDTNHITINDVTMADRVVVESENGDIILTATLYRQTDYFCSQELQSIKPVERSPLQR